MKDAVVDGKRARAIRPASAKARRGTGWWAETKSAAWLLLIVLGFHSFVAKPFYIPSESMLPGLQVGDRLVVNKFIYGWSFVSPTIPNPVAIVDSLVLHGHEDSWAVRVPFIHGRLFGRLPVRGDVVIVTPPGTNTDYIKRVIGLPGDTIEVRDGTVILNGRPVERSAKHMVDVPAYGDTIAPDGDQTCGAGAVIHEDGQRPICRLPVVTETLPGGVRFDTVDERDDSPGDNYRVGNPVKVPANHVFLMGDNRDNSADSRFPLGEASRGLGGPVPYENIGGRAEFVTFSFDGSAGWLNPLSWWRSLRPGRAGVSLHPEKAGH